MATETPADEFDQLVMRAVNCGLYLNRHKEWDVLSESGGDLYLMERRTMKNPRPPTIVKYARADEIEEALTEREREIFRRTA